MTAGIKAQFEDKKSDLVVKDFKGVNTQAGRTSIAEDEFAWLENLMPVGPANLKCVPHQDVAVAVMPASTVVYWKYINIGNTDYLMIASAGGGVYAVNLATYVVTTVRAPGTLTGTVAMAQWKNERVLIVAGNGYFDWNGTTWTVLTSVSGAPASGSTIATFAGRVWVGSARTVTYSAPNAYNDFTTANAGGAFIVTDETLHSNIYALITANNFLYLFGDASINVISDVRVVAGTPPLTIFSNVNISALIGSSLPLAIFPYYRLLVFATPYGFYVLSGTTPQKVSDHLDGVFPLIDFTKPITGDVALIFNILCIAFCFNYKDPTGARALIALNFNKKWFFANQGTGLTLVAGVFQSGVPALFGTDGANIYKLFSNATNSLPTTLISALWPMKAPTHTKQVLKMGVEVTTGPTPTPLTVTADSDFASTSPVNLSSTNIVQWQNDAGQPVEWVNNAGAPVQWATSGFQIYQGDMHSYGRYVGQTIKATAPGYVINGLLAQYETKPSSWAARA